MEYDEEENRASGSIPEFGAIFMSNIETKKECFKRKIFALPSSKGEFVKHIKAGMVLFLFEFKKRQLFGVYQATSDGAMNIVPHAFNYSGKRFPAQVCFTPIWQCDPLSEKEFRDAIRENYFSAKKFNFGLSEDQVRRLLYLFSSRKLKTKVPPHPLSEAIVEVAGRDRRMVVDDKLELTERGSMEAAENDEFNPAAFYDHHVNSLARPDKDEVLIDDGVNTEGNVYPLSQEDFLAKRRKIGNDDSLVTNDVAEDRIYNHGTLQTFHNDSLEYSLDELRRLADAHRLLAVERVNKYQVDKILNPEYVVDPLDVRAEDDHRFMQRSRLFYGYNTGNGSRQAFASDHYGKSLDKTKHAIDDDRFLLDDSLQGDHNTHDKVKPMAYGDSNLNLYRQTTDMIDDHECFMNRKLENRYHLDYDGSPITFLDPSASLLHKLRKTTAAGRFPISESEPDFGTCYVEGFSSEKFSSSMQRGHRNIHDRKYPIREGRLTENMVDNILCSATLDENAGPIASADRRVVDDERFRKSEKVDVQEDVHNPTNPVMSMEFPSFSQPNQNLSSFSEKLLPEKGLSKFTVSHNFDLPRSTFDDATITRAVPFVPEHPNFSHGLSASITANQNSSLVRENHPHHGSVGNFCSLSKNSMQQYLDLEKSGRSLDIAPEFGNNGFPTSTPGYQSSLPHESGSSFVNSNLPMHVDRNTSASVNYRGSLYSKLSPPCTDLESMEGGKGMFAYPSNSRENHFVFDRNLPTASQHVSKHVPYHEMDMLAGKDFSCSEAKEFGLGICHPERDLARHENQQFRFSSNMHLKELHKISEASHANFKVNRKSVFTRLTSGEESQFGEERNDTDINHHHYYMDATADEVMEMLKQHNNLSPKKLRKSRVGGEPTQPTRRGHAVNGKKTQCHIETSNSTMEKKKLDDPSLATADSMDEVPKETRVMDFKRRSERKKILVGISADSAADNKITGANEEIKSSINSSLRRKKLVRPVFTKTEPATDATLDNETLQIPAQILNKDDERSCRTAISLSESEMPNDNTKLSNRLVSCSHQSIDCNNEGRQNPEEQKDLAAHVLPSTSHQLKEHETTIVDLQIGSSEVLKDTTQRKTNIDATHTGLNVQGSSLEGFKLGAGSGSNLIEE